MELSPAGYIPGAPGINQAPLLLKITVTEGAEGQKCPKFGPKTAKIG